MKSKHILILILSLSLLISCGKKLNSSNSKSSPDKKKSTTQNVNREDNDKESNSQNFTSTETTSDSTNSDSNNNDSNNSVETNTEIHQDTNSSLETNEIQSKEDKTENSNSNNESEKNNSHSNTDKELSENTTDKNKDQDAIERNNVNMKVLAHSQIPSNVLNKIDRVKENRGYITSKDENYLYIAILAGKKTSSGYNLKIADVYSEDSNLIINIDQVSPQPKDNVLTVITYPYIVIRLDITFTAITITDNEGVEFNPIIFGEAM